MHKWLVYLSDDRGFIINSQNDETVTNSLSPTIAPSKGGKEGKTRVDPSLSQKIKTRMGRKRAQEQIMFQRHFLKWLSQKRKKTTLPHFAKFSETCSEIVQNAGIPPISS
jgi:hypothetical protein